MNLKKLFGYENKNVVITGAASGMAKSATELLLELGANVYAIDINPIDLAVKQKWQADLSSKDVLDNIIKELPEHIDALFLCHGIAEFPDNKLKVQLVNFYGQKYLADNLLSKINENGSITFISSVGGFGWEENYQTCVELINEPTWLDAMKWYENHPEKYQSAYVFAKQCLESYVTYKCMDPSFIARKIRLNAINPGDTITGLTDDFNKSTGNGDMNKGEEIIKNIFLSSWNGYPASPEQMGYPLVVVGSQICSYMSGQLIYLDYGLTSSWKSRALLNKK